MKYFLSVVACCIVGLMMLPGGVYAQQTEFFRGEVVTISADSKTMFIIVTKSDQSQEKIELPTYADKLHESLSYKIGDQLILSRQELGDKPAWGVVERDRTMSYIVIFVVFVVFVILIARWGGVLSLGAMAVSFMLLSQFTIPQIIAGVDPVVVSLMTAVVIVPLTFYFSHGFQKKTTLAVVATFVALALTGVLAVVFVRLMHLTGYASDEAAAMSFRFGESLRLSDVLVSGMIISAMGVLDDVTISQIGIVQSLDKVRPDIKGRQLFAEAMELGRDHIASLVNTLVLVYAGAALPLFLLVQKTEVPIWIVLQRESIAEEVTRSLVSSIGIIAAVPIATVMAVRWGRRQRGHLQKEKLF